MQRTILIGDVHGDKLSHIIPNANARKIKVCNDILKDNKGKAKRVVFLGDISDKTTMSSEFYYLLQNLILKWDKHYKIYILAGNHDKDSIEHFSMNLMKPLFDKGRLNAKFIDAPCVEDWEGTKVEFLPFPNKVPTIKKGIVFAHTEYEGSMADNGFKLPTGKNTILEKDVKGNTFYVGHLHKFQEYKKAQVYFPGAPYMLTVGESEEKYYYILKGKNKHKKVRIKNSWYLRKGYPKNIKELKKLLKKKEVYYKLELSLDMTDKVHKLLYSDNVISYMVDKPNVDKKDSVESRESFYTTDPLDLSYHLIENSKDSSDPKVIKKAKKMAKDLIERHIR